MRNIKTREGYDYWDKLCAIPSYGFIHSPDNSRILKAEGLGNWIDQHAAQEVVDAAQDEINDLRARLAQLEQHPQWISVDAQLPESERTVLAYYLNSHGKGRRVRAEYIAAKTKCADDGWDSDSPADYDEATDQYYWPAGWYEVIDNWDDLTHMVIHEGEVTHWLPLPAAPTP